MTQPATGGGPPQNIEPSELWTKLTTLPRPHTEVAFPRKHPVTKEQFTDKVAIWVLTEGELMSVRASSEAYARDLLGSPRKLGEANTENRDLMGGLGYQEIYRNACVVEVIWRACRSVIDVRLPAFPSTLMIRKYFTADECAALFQAYCTWQSESGPLLSNMSTEEMDAWIDAAAEGASAVPLAVLSLDARNQLIVHSALLLQKYRRASGLPGAPPGASSTSSSRPSRSVEDPGSPSNKLELSSGVDPAERMREPERDE